MRPKNAIIAFAFALLSISSAHAATNITGDVYGQVFSTMEMNDGGIPYGVTIEDINTADKCDNSTQTCFLEGFSWADVVGWTFWNGAALQTELGGVGNFPDEYIPKVSYIGGMDGFAWGEKFGWLQLSACASIDAQAACDAKSYCNWTGTNHCEIDNSNNVPDVSSQTDSDWGAYVDFCPLKTTQPECEDADSDQYCNWDAGDSVCVFDAGANPGGQPLRGYAWSQYLGWVKFGPEAGDTEFNGAFTNWFPDLTPPVFKGVEEGWIPNESMVGTISWLEFADENESQIDLISSSVTVNTDMSADFAGCPMAAPQANGDLILSQGGNGEVNLTIPLIGLIGTPPYGFCKYTLGGVIYNGSGFGYYFGPEGIAQAAVDGVDTSSPANAAPATYDNDPVTLYVRAGDPDSAVSRIIFTMTSGVGDGNDKIDLRFAPADIGGNYIIPVRSALSPGTLPEPVQADWVRDLEIVNDLDQNSEYYFDRLDIARNFSLNYPLPVNVEGAYYGVLDPLTYVNTGVHTAGSYLMDIWGYAPTLSAGNILELTNISLETTDQVLPAVSPSMGPWNTSGTIVFDNSSPMPGNPLPFSYDFDPALEVTDGELNAQFIIIGQPVEASYDIVNNSSDSLQNYSLDHLMVFSDTGGIGEEVLELKDINLSGLADTATRTDPDSTDTRYQLQRNSGTEGVNEFHSSSQNYHTPSYGFNSATDGSGVYSVDGEYYVSPEDDCLSTPPCPAVNIDRSDSLSSDLTASGGTGSYVFGITPSQYIGEQINAQVTFGITQYLSYHAQQNPFVQYALYQAQPEIDGIEVKSIGLGTSGVVSGGQVFETVGGRDLETISTTSSADLRREIRRNVAVLTRNITPCAAPQTLNTLSTANGGCIAVDTINNTVVAVYEGPGLITLGNGADMTVPTGYKYTIILLDGANLAIESNLTYGGDTDNSFGMIVMQDAAGGGGNVYMDPAPTNMVGLLYAEGSLLSSPDGGTTLYYGGGGSANDLKNQLFWQGSIASANTIGGAPNKVVPDNVDCSPWGGDAGSCSQAYDLDFIRRFATINDTGVDFAPVGYTFSGGGSCAVGAAPNPGCALGGLPTTVTLAGDAIDVNASKSLDTFFIERDNRAVPQGFSSSGGLTSSQEIR